MASSTAMVSGTSVMRSSMITVMVRTSQSSVSHHCPTAYHHTWLAAIAASSAAVHRRNLRLVLKSSPTNALPRLSSRYKQATTARKATPQ